MAQYKVPQDVEADDKLIGPFGFRQFVYLLIAAGLIALAVGLFQLFPLLALIPLPPVFLFLVLALPLKKDQPMETYLAAMVSYYLKPHTRTWTPGQRESTIFITAPKKVEDIRTRDISGEEATHRLSFLANLVDSEGYAIKEGVTNSSMRADLVTEANAMTDMFDSYNSENYNRAVDQAKSAQRQMAMQEMQTALQKKADEKSNVVDEEKRREEEERQRILAEQKRQREEAERKLREEEMHRLNAAHEEALNAMRSAISHTDDIDTKGAMIQNNRGKLSKEPEEKPAPTQESVKTESKEEKEDENTKKVVTEPAKSSIMELANNPDFSVATIAKEANRLNKKEEGEVFISLH